MAGFRTAQQHRAFVVADLLTSLPAGADSSRAPSANEFAAFADALPEAAWIADREGWIYWYNKRWYEYTGTTPEQMQGWGWQVVHDPSTLPTVLERWKRSIATGEDFEMVFPIRGADGLFRPFLTRVRPLRNQQGEITHWIGTNTDVAEQERQKRLLQTLNETAALVGAELDLERLVQAVTDAGVRLTGAQFGAFFYNVVNDKGEGYTLYTISGVPREWFSKFPMPRNTEVFEPTFRGQGIIRSDDITEDPRYGRNPPYSGMPKGHLPVRSYLAVPVISRSGEVLGGLFFGHGSPGMFTAYHEQLLTGVAAQAAVSIDNARLYKKAQEEIARREKLEEGRRLLIRELNHRVKNAFAIVGGLVLTTAARTASVSELATTLNGRILSLARAHELIYAAYGQPTEMERAPQLRELIAAVLAPYAGDTQRRVEGPDLEVKPTALTSLTLVLHELTTNAVKYGSLSVPSGMVLVTWSVNERVLRLSWTETGGPTIESPPASTGFGAQLIEMSATGNLGGTTERHWDKTGLRFVFDAPLDRIRMASDTDAKPSATPEL
jgi:PAS domain S-box-containing protein